MIKVDKGKLGGIKSINVAIWHIKKSNAVGVCKKRIILDAS